MLMLVYDNHKSFLNWLLMLSYVIGTINFVQLVSLHTLYLPIGNAFTIKFLEKPHKYATSASQNGHTSHVLEILG